MGDYWLGHHLIEIQIIAKYLENDNISELLCINVIRPGLYLLVILQFKIIVLEKIYVISHNDEIIDVPDEESIELHNKISEVTKDYRSDSIYILTPHGTIISSGIPAINTENLYGEY